MEAGELVGIRRALDVEAAQTAAAAWTDAGLANVERVFASQEEACQRQHEEIDMSLWCTECHDAIARASGNRLLADLNTSLSASLDEVGLSARAAHARPSADRDRPDLARR